MHHHLGTQHHVHRPRTSRSQRRHPPSVERLEDRCLPDSAPAGFGPLPSVVIGLTAQQVNQADAVINWNATMLRAIWNAGTAPTLASRVEAIVGVAVYDTVEGVNADYELYPVP